METDQVQLLIDFRDHATEESATTDPQHVPKLLTTVVKELFSIRRRQLKFQAITSLASTSFISRGTRTFIVIWTKASQQREGNWSLKKTDLTRKTGGWSNVKREKWKKKEEAMKYVRTLRATRKYASFNEKRAKI